jgi:hypothetical protein
MLPTETGLNFWGIWMCVICLCRYYLKNSVFLNQLISYHRSCMFLVTKVCSLNSGRFYPVICGNVRGQMKGQK